MQQDWRRLLLHFDSIIQISLSASHTPQHIMSDSAAAPQLNTALQPRNVGGVRRRAQTSKDASTNRPNSTRAAGAGGSSNTMLRIYTDDSKGLTVDPVVVLVLAISFVLSVVVLHIIGKLARWFYK
ncbi:unnamed protein product [Sympodiomycopsis kandeliae]